MSFAASFLTDDRAARLEAAEATAIKALSLAVCRTGVYRTVG
jgi:hypothetical protein